VAKNVTDTDQLVKQTELGSMIILKQGEEFQWPQGLQLNLQAIEEGNMARADMDFASAATEDSLRGVAAAGDSGIKIGIQQNAAVTPLNKWVKASRKARTQGAKKLLKMIITEWGDKPAQLIRIVGMQKFQELIMPKLNPLTGQVIENPMEWPLAVDASAYDVKVTDESISDLHKQQSFNAVIAVHEMSGGQMFDDEFIIKSMPIKNTDDALASNERKRNDIMQQLMMQMQMMQAQMGEMQKQIPKDGPRQNTANARRGRNAPQGGQRSMMGGASSAMTGVR